MNKLMQALRTKKHDDVKSIPPRSNKKPTKKKNLSDKKKETKLSLNDTQFRTFLSMFMDNKETVSSLSKQNDEYKPKLVEYVRAKGTEDGSGHRLLPFGDIIAKVQISRHKVLIVSKVEKLLYSLRKKKTITPKEEKSILNAQYHITIGETAYQAMQAELDNWGAVVNRQVSVDEDQLKMLVANGKVTLDKLNELYETEERSSFVPTRVKKE